MPKKPKSPKALYGLLILLFVVSAVVISVYLANEFSYQHVQSEADPIPELEDVDVPTPTSLPIPTQAPAITDDYEPAPTEPTPEPGPTLPPRIMRQEFIDLRAFYNNDDIVGRVWIENTTVDYTVAQHAYDNNFYLDHNLRRREYGPGSIFLDYKVDLHAGTDQNMVLYGHNMARNHKFHMVRRFLIEDFFHDTRHINFSTIYADYVFEVFSVYITNWRNWPYIEPNYDDWDYWISQFAARSRFDPGFTVSGEDRILTLSTCDSSYIDNRIVVHAVLRSVSFPHLDIDGPEAAG